MAIKRQIPHNYGMYFLTITCYKWLPLFQLTSGCEIIYKWFDYLKQQGHFITGYVVMPNHLHTTIGFRNTDKTLNSIVGNGKRFIAYGIINRLEKMNLHMILEKLSRGVNKSDKKRKKLHEVWESSFDWKECISTSFIIQKLDYMHNNPCIGKWQLASSPVEYLHSSARFYLTGEQGVYPITHYLELEDIDLTKPITIFS
jgi:putative transposase